MTHRALSLLDLRSPSLILDIGCGSGLSGSILSQPSKKHNPSGPHTWIGLDISASMLAIALDRSHTHSTAASGDLLLADMGQGLPFRAGSFDAAISISAIQWLCNAETSADCDDPKLRLRRFFDTLYSALKRGARAVCQFYPRDEAQRAMICAAAVRAGFGAGVLEDDVGSKNAKLYLVLTVGGGGMGAESGSGGRDITGVVKGLDGVEVVDQRKGREREKARGKRGREAKAKKGGKEWILRKKEQMVRKGMVVKKTSKYTGRKRNIAF